MGRISWARAAQFNWTFDNTGGCPLEECVPGATGGATALVQAGSRVDIEAPGPGAGSVCYVRGVWLEDTGFASEDFWSEPDQGDRTDYYRGGSFVNQGAVTTLTLGTALAEGTPVQVYYLYRTGETSIRYEALNNYPCIRRAWRQRDDYTFDFAVDRLLDLMVLLHLAGRERGRDYGPMIRFLWQALKPREESRSSPLMQDSFERRAWDQGLFPLYRGASEGAVFQVFRTEAATGFAGRALHVGVELPSLQDGAWFGYGLNWALKTAPFSRIDRLSFKLKGINAASRIHNLTKIAAGSADLVISGDYAHQEKRRFVVQVQTAGEVGQATCRWSRDGGLTWEESNLITGDRQHPLDLWGGLKVHWESGDGPDLMDGDYWQFWAGEPAEHPRRLLITLNDSTAQDQDPWGAGHVFGHALPDRFPESADFEIPFAQFWRRDNIIDDGDRVRGMWGAWYSATQQDQSDITISDREETEVLFGETFYTQRQVVWELSDYVTAFGVWMGVDPGRCDSTGHTQVNFLIRPVVSGAASLTLRVKVKDARGSYFYKNVLVQVDAWQRVAVNLADMTLESGGGELTHPLQAVDLGLPANPPDNGAFYLTDVKFDEHVAFPGAAGHLRLLEFKIEPQGLSGHEWWLDDVSLNLEAEDPYPYAPREAISLTPEGQSPFRGPTLVHYAQPLAPYLEGALDQSQVYLSLHREAQEEFHRRYGGLKGPILPVHTRNDVENIALCGEENFNRFCWWPRFRDYGKSAAFWPFNESLADASDNGRALTWEGGGSPTYANGLCQPGNTALALDGAHWLSHPDTPDFNLGEAMTFELLIKPDSGWDPGAVLLDKMGSESGPGYRVLRQGDTLELAVLINDSLSHGGALAPGQYNYLAVTCQSGQISAYINGTPAFSGTYAGSAGNSAPLLVGKSSGGGAPFTGDIDYIRIYQDLALDAGEIEDRWKIIQGQLNGSEYPEAGAALGQYWAFLRLAQYYFVTGDTGAQDILGNWLAWIEAYGAEDGAGWKFPQQFSEYGFTYGPYDPGAAASVALGCLYLYLRDGDETAAVWARRILDDLRQNRWGPESGGYKSDYHYAWINALVLQAFGLAVNGQAGQAYVFPATPEDGAHFEQHLDWVFARSGDSKPNLLNSEMIPFTCLEDADVWDYAPNYIALRQMGSLEAVVGMAGAALEYGKAQGNWDWFDRLLGFILLDNFAALAPGQIRSLTYSYDLAGVENVVRVYWGDYDRDPGQYAEARDEEAIAREGEKAANLDFRYGEPVVLESPEMAKLLAARRLARLGRPWEVAEVETWLEGARVELGDTLAVAGDFPQSGRGEYTVFGKSTDLKARRVTLKLARAPGGPNAWAVDAGGSASDSRALDQPGSEGCYAG